MLSPWCVQCTLRLSVSLSATLTVELFCHSASDTNHSYLMAQTPFQHYIPPGLCLLDTRAYVIIVAMFSAWKEQLLLKE